MEEYITAEELSSRIKEKKQTVYNRIYKQEFILGIHYVKPTPKKLLFKWSAIVRWLEGPDYEFDTRTDPSEAAPLKSPPSATTKSIINI
jgi:hypothetical protein